MEKLMKKSGRKAFLLTEVQVSGNKLIGIRVKQLQERHDVIVYYIENIEKQGMPYSWERRRPHPNQIIRKGDYLGIQNDPAVVRQLVLINQN